MILSVFRDSRGLEFLDFQNTDASNIPMPLQNTPLHTVLPRDQRLMGNHLLIQRFTSFSSLGSGVVVTSSHLREIQRLTGFVNLLYKILTVDFFPLGGFLARKSPVQPFNNSEDLSSSYLSSLLSLLGNKNPLLALLAAILRTLQLFELPLTLRTPAAAVFHFFAQIHD
jgi:hypothetical protein